MGARIRVKRVYDEPSGDDGFRVLVDCVLVLWGVWAS
jgi:uncharacterized protein YeaO (DUF488 family)